MDIDDRALDGLLRELSRAPRGADEAFLGRVFARTERKIDWKPLLLMAAAVLVAALGFLLEPPATARLGFAPQACLVPGAKTMRLLLNDGVLLGEVSIDAPVRVPAGLPIRLQAVDADGYALWTSPSVIRPSASRARGGIVLDQKTSRSVDYARDVKPILDQHCAGCHAESEIVSAAAVKPFDARKSALVTQTHAPIPAAERRQLALWVDLGATARP